MHVLPDPPVPGAPADQWWPPVALTAEWLVAHEADYDVLHVHFGLESFSPDELQGALDAARRVGRPVVYTVHDLENPQLVDQQPYRALLDVIVPAADRLLTLTEGASAEIRQRWGRESQVLAHPTLLERVVATGRGDAEAIRVGIHLRDLRPNIAAEHAIHAAVGAAALLVEAGIPVQFDVLMNERVRDEEAAARVLATAERHPAVRVRRTPHLTDAEIEEWLGGIDLFVLPYHHGTHSGWVELCYDLGVRVAGTDVGHIGAQHPDDFTAIDLDDAQTLADAVQLTAGTPRPSERAGVVEERRNARAAEREAVRAAHADVYAAVCAEVRA
ncbi:hypothetical protein RS85_03520 [Microbacterium sp. SA39]|nr:hypothetical protein RS85_03520 [Microbacterium sp. SA39]